MSNNSSVRPKMNKFEKADRNVKENEKKYIDIKTVNEYVKVTRNSLQLWIKWYENQLEMLDTLAEMSDEEKEDMLFNILDKDKDGHINARELTNGFRANNAGITFNQGLERAITYVAMFDADIDATLDREEFKNFLTRVTAEADSTFHDMCEYLLMNMIYSMNRNTTEEEDQAAKRADQIDEIVKKKGRYLGALSDERMMDLFSMFDQDGTGVVSFEEVANGVYKMKDTFSKSTQEVIQVMVMYDRDHNRTLEYNEFAQFILGICAAGQMQFNDIAEALIDAVSYSDDMDMRSLELAKALYTNRQNFIDQFKEQSAVENVLEYIKIDKLYDLWDTDDSGSISYEELTLGLRKYMKTTNLVAMTEETLFMMLENDGNKDQVLEKDQFATFLVRFAKKTEKNIYELIDFLAALSVLKENDEAEKEYIKSIAEQANSQIKAVEEYNPNNVASDAPQPVNPARLPAPTVVNKYNRQPGTWV
mmetsp:Transcript_26877/g.40680  ORF Transcript_26877/g.40680 Transcript_26877/m.40680 type:complete len:477 (+) Transcript_26877:26-1456(+)